MTKHMHIPIITLFVLWRLLGDIPVNDDGFIEESFLGFPVGTHREDIWHWFEDSNSDFIVGEVMQGKHYHLTSKQVDDNTDWNHCPDGEGDV